MAEEVKAQQPALKAETAPSGKKALTEADVACRVLGIGRVHAPGVIERIKRAEPDIDIVSLYKRKSPELAHILKTTGKKIKEKGKK